MKIVPNIKLRETLYRRYWRATRNVLIQVRQSVVDKADHLDPERLKEETYELLNARIMNDHLIDLWSHVGGRFGFDTEKLFNQSKSESSGIEQKDVITLVGSNKKPVKSAKVLTEWQANMRRYAAERSLEKTKAILTTQQQAINKVIDDVIKEAQSGDVWLSIPDTRNLLKERLSSELTTIENWQAERIARTEVNGASNTGSFEAAKENAEGCLKEWITSGLPNTRESHLAYEALGQVELDYDYASGLQFPGDENCQDGGDIINCYTGDLEIKGLLIAAQKSFYSGKIREIKTVGGKWITVTPNHNILTANGFIKANDINIGEDLVCNTEKVNVVRQVFRRGKNINNKKSLVKNVFNSFDSLFSNKPRPVIDLDFDNDGKFMKGDITIINSNRKLPVDQKFLVKDFGEFGFKHTRAKAFLIKCFCSFNFGIKSVFSSSDSLMGILHLSFPFCFRHLRPFNLFTIGLSSHNYIIFSKIPIKSYADNAGFLRELIKTYPGFIHLDKVLEVRDIDFSGHVYDFTSLTGTNIVNNIYTSNCRCTYVMDTNN